MKKVIAFSLWGNIPKYTLGAIENAKLAKKIYPGWTTRFYVGETTNSAIIEQLKNEGAEVILMHVVDEWSGLFWRFNTLEDPTVEITIFRDTDSRLSKREKLAVDDWIQSSYTFHIMRDHPYHGYAILGGMWGAKNVNVKNLQESMIYYTWLNKWGADQSYLKDVFFPRMKNNVLVHDEFYEGLPFPAPRVGLEFVGNVFDEFNQQDVQFSELLDQYLKGTFVPLTKFF